MNSTTHGDVITEIPRKPNMAIMGYKVVVSLSGNQEIISYKPMFSRIHQLDNIYRSSKGLVYLVNDDGQVYTTKGEYTTVYVRELTPATEQEVTNFKKELESNGYVISNGTLTPTKYWMAWYSLEEGFVPIPGKIGDHYYEQFKKWDEAFETESACINWCNYLNEKLNRDYKEL